MKFALDVKKLKNAISHLARLTSKHASLPVLESIIISAEKKEVVLRATNLHIGMEVRIAANVEEEGVAAIPGVTLLSLVNSLSGDGDVVCKKQHENVLITKDGSRALLKTVPHDDFPTLPKVEGANFEINSNVISVQCFNFRYQTRTFKYLPLYRRRQSVFCRYRFISPGWKEDKHKKYPRYRKHPPAVQKRCRALKDSHRHECVT